MPNLPAFLAGDDFLSRYAHGRRTNAGDPIGTGPFQFAASTNGVLTLDRERKLLAGTAVPRSDRTWRQPADPRPVARPERGPHRCRRGSGQSSCDRRSSSDSPSWCRRRSSCSALAGVGFRSAGESLLRAAIAHAVDRSALFNVIFQKQGEITASLLAQRSPATRSFFLRTAT